MTCLHMSKSVHAIRRELSDLIREAVPENDPARRQALLVLADHWSDIMRRRSAETRGDVRPEG